MPILRARPSRVQYHEPPSDQDRSEWAEANESWHHQDGDPPFVAMDVLIASKRRRVHVDLRDEPRDPYEDAEPFEWVPV